MGWHRQALGLSTGKQLSEKETQQFQIDLILLEQHLSESTMVKAVNMYKRSGYFTKQKCPPVSQCKMVLVDMLVMSHH